MANMSDLLAQCTFNKRSAFITTSIVMCSYDDLCAVKTCSHRGLYQRDRCSKGWTKAVVPISYEKQPQQ